MKIKAKHLLIGGGILASIIALTSMSSSANSTNTSSSGSGSGSGNNQRTGEEGTGLTNSSLENKINSDANLQIKMDIARIETEIEILRKDHKFHNDKCDNALQQKKWAEYDAHDIKRREIEKEILYKEGELKFLKSLL